RHLPVPTPVISHAILKHNAGEAYRTWLAGSAAAGASYRSAGHDVADGIVATPSHNPPGDGGFKYNPPHGGPAGSTETSEVQIGRHLPVPTPVISHAILKHNAGEAYRTWLAGSAAAGASYRSAGHDVADGIVATPSHNPPGDGGFKYNPPHGGPAGSTETSEV